MRVYLVRHGQTDWNLSHRWQGRKDIPLDETGIMQAHKVSERFCSLPIKRIYASPLIRAAKTAQIIQSKTSAELIYIEDMKEISLGEWEGHTREQLRQMYGKQFEQFETDVYAVTPPDIENYYDLQIRAIKVFREICEDNSEPILLVGHGAWILTLMMELLNMPLHAPSHFEISNTGISIVDVSQNNYVVHTLNDVSHLGM